MRQPPHPRMDIPISLAVYQQLLGASNRTGFEKEYWEIAAEAVDEWMRRHDPDAISMPETSGYQWKSLFLPNGTLLRTIFDGKNHHCLVENDQILYQGHAVTPSGFVNEVGGIRRNAWRYTWILLPDDKHWKLADTLRVRERALRAHRPARTHYQAPAAAQPCANCAASPPSSPASHAPASHTPASHTAASHAPASHTSASHAPASHAPASYAPSSHTPASHTPASQTSTSYAPAASAPAPSSLHPGAEPEAADCEDEINLTPARQDKPARTHTPQEASRQHRSGSTLLPLRCRRGADRRTSGQHRIAPLLSDPPPFSYPPLPGEVPLPPLDLVHALDEERPETRFQLWSPTRRTT